MVTRLLQPIPARTLAALRIIFGALMTVSCVRFIALGWIDDQYIMPMVHFPYEGFEWVVSLGSPGMYILYAVMTIAALCIMIGAWYRWSAVTFFLLFTYVELIDKTYYLNHYYFVSIAAFLFCLVPAHRAWSVDVRRRPTLRADTVPRWTVDIFKVSIGLVYFFAGIAKINEAWLIDAMPLRLWLPAHDDLLMIGPLFTLAGIPWVFAWCGMIYDVTVPFFLLSKRTRPYAYIVVVVFHVITGMLFQIGVFPLVMIGMTLIFFEPEFTAKLKPPTTLSHHIPRFQRTTLALLAVHVMIQVLLPLRYALNRSDLFWHEEGYRFSWRVMLVEKAGTALFTVTDRATGRTGYVDNAQFLNAHQEKQMAFQPDMILQYAHILHDHYEQQGMNDPIVHAEVWVTMNGEPSRMMVDPTVDLSREVLGWHSNDWVLARD
jgi:hypothetical protein